MTYKKNIKKAIESIKAEANNTTEEELLSVCLKVLSEQRRKTQSL